jgi:quercetin dioxygenase-like cupin family protein
MVEILKWDEVPLEQVAEGMSRQIVTGEKMTIARIYFDDGFIVPLHAHENEQVTQVVEGTMRFWFDEAKTETRDLHAGEVMVIPPHFPHGAQMIGRVVEIDMWSPRREDWLKKTDDYLRGGTAGALSETVDPARG